MYTYCFFCQTQRCRILAELITKATGSACLSPQIIQRKWVKGKAFDESHDMLPGYIFLYCEEELRSPLRLDGILRMLGNGPLQYEDHQFAMSLLRADGVMGHVKVLKEGDRCVIRDPVWEGFSGTIVKLDRGRKRCCVEYRFDGNTRRIWAAYDLLDSTEGDANLPAGGPCSPSVES